MSYLLISKNIHNLIENDPSTLVSTLIAHIKSIDVYTTTYRKVLLAKQKAIEDIYDNKERSYHDLPILLQVMQQFLTGMVVEKEISHNNTCIWPSLYESTKQNHRRCI